MAKRFPAHKVKGHRIYTPWEAAECLECNRQTIRNWISSGKVEADTTRRPWLIRGADLKDFLDQRRARNRSQLQIDHFYCFGCKAPQEAGGKMADYTQITSTTGQLTALCARCDSVMKKIIRRLDLPVVQAKLEVTLQQASPRLVSCPEPCSNVNFGRGDQTHVKKA